MSVLDDHPIVHSPHPHHLHRDTHPYPRCPSCRLVQEPGSFVVTFPGAYHAGFNTGFNVAESVNFASPDWLTHGTDVVRKYRMQGKAPVISHDALLITIAQVCGYPLGACDI